MKAIEQYASIWGYGGEGGGHNNHTGTVGCGYAIFECEIPEPVIDYIKGLHPKKSETSVEYIIEENEKV